MFFILFSFEKASQFYVALFFIFTKKIGYAIKNQNFNFKRRETLR